MAQLTYWRVHFLYTLPPTLLLYLLVRPFLTRRDYLRIGFLASIAVLWTFPWDDYIISHKAWTYAPWAVSFTISRVPVEEVAFFVTQSLLTCQLHLLLSLSLSPAQYLIPRDRRDLAKRRPWTWRFLRWSPSFVLLLVARKGWKSAIPATQPFYISCIAFWALPVLAFLWLLIGDYLLRRPYANTLTVLIVPTLYLCTVDTVALRAGTWRIEPPTSLGVTVWRDLPIEEALFFLLTNALLVVGMATFEKAYVVLDLWPELGLPSRTKRANATAIPEGFTWTYVCASLRALTTDLGALPLSRRARPRALETSAGLLQKKSRSFSLASLALPHGGGTGSRQDMTILYAWCRTTDDMIDNAVDAQSAKIAFEICKDFLDLVWGRQPAGPKAGSTNEVDGQAASERPVLHPSDFEVNRFLSQHVPAPQQPPFLLLAALKQQLQLPRYPFDALLEGYLWDVEQSWRPISSEEDLIDYSAKVAGSVGEMCVWAMWARHRSGSLPPSHDVNAQETLAAARDAGICLQLVNIARDIQADAAQGRSYVPETWLQEAKASVSEDGLRQRKATNGHSAAISSPIPPHRASEYALRLLRLAGQRYDHQRYERAVGTLPLGCKAGVRAALALYLEIGAELTRRITGPEGFSGGEANGAAGWGGERVRVSNRRRLVVAMREIWQIPIPLGGVGKTLDIPASKTAHKTA